MAYCTLAQLERAVGGAANSLQLSGANTTGDALYTTFTTECMNGGSAELASLLGVQYVASSVDTTDLALGNHAASVSAWWAWKNGPGGQAQIPPGIADGREEAMRWAQRLADRKGVLNQATAGKAQPVAQIDLDPDGTLITPFAFRMSGFR